MSVALLMQMSLTSAKENEGDAVLTTEGLHERRSSSVVKVSG